MVSRRFERHTICHRVLSHHVLLQASPCCIWPCASLSAFCCGTMAGWATATQRRTCPLTFSAPLPLNFTHFVYFLCLLREIMAAHHGNFVLAPFQVLVEIRHLLHLDFHCSSHCHRCGEECRCLVLCDRPQLSSSLCLLPTTRSPLQCNVGFLIMAIVIMARQQKKGVHKSKFKIV